MTGTLSDVIQRLKQQRDDVMNKLHVTKGASFGDSIGVTFSLDYALENRIQLLGRFTYADGIREYHAGPLGVDRSRVTELAKYGHLEEAERYFQGESTSFNTQRSYEFTKFLDLEKNYLHSVEKVVLPKLVQEVGPIVLVNPAIGTLWRCQDLPVTIYLDGEGAGRKKEIQDTLLKMRVNWQFENQYSDNKFYYLGSNGRNWESYRWACLTPNPFAPVFPYGRFSFTGKEGHYILEYERKSWKVAVEIDAVPNHYRYSPADVDRICRSTERAFFLDSSEKLHISAESKDVGPIAFYVPEEFPNLEAEEGTWLSRLGRSTCRHDLKMDGGDCAVGWYGRAVVTSPWYQCGEGKSTIKGLALTTERSKISGDAMCLIYSPLFQSRRDFPILEGGYEYCPWDVKMKRFYMKVPPTGFFFVCGCLSELSRYQMMIMSHTRGGVYVSKSFLHRPLVGGGFRTMADRVVASLQLLKTYQPTGAEEAVMMINAMRDTNSVNRLKIEEAMSVMLTDWNTIKIKIDGSLSTDIWLDNLMNQISIRHSNKQAKPNIVAIADMSDSTTGQVHEVLSGRRDTVWWNESWYYADRFEGKIPCTKISFSSVLFQIHLRYFARLPGELEIWQLEIVKQFLFEQGMGQIRSAEVEGWWHIIRGSNPRKEEDGWIWEEAPKRHLSSSEKEYLIEKRIEKREEEVSF